MSGITAIACLIIFGLAYTGQLPYSFNYLLAQTLAGKISLFGGAVLAGGLALVFCVCYSCYQVFFGEASEEITAARNEYLKEKQQTEAMAADFERQRIKYAAQLEQTKADWKIRSENSALELKKIEQERELNANSITYESNILTFFYAVKSVERKVKFAEDYNNNKFLSRTINASSIENYKRRLDEIRNTLSQLDTQKDLLETEGRDIKLHDTDRQRHATQLKECIDKLKSLQEITNNLFSTLASFENKPSV